MEEVRVLMPKNIEQMPTPPKGNNLEQAVGDDGPTPVLSPLSPVLSPLERPDPPKAPEEPQYICYTCRRRLGSQEMLEKHEQFSQLHEKNVRIMKQAAHRRRAEIRNDVVRLRNTLSPSTGDADLKKQEADLGLVQEDFEEKSNSLLRGSETLYLGEFRLDIAGQSWTGNKAGNEDRMVLAFEIDENVKGCMIADGHCGEVCADYLVENFSNSLSSAFASTSDVKEALVIAFRETDSKFLAHATANQIPSGSTAIVVLFFLIDTALHCMTAHVGDSRALLVPFKGQDVVRLTSDHKPDREDEKLRLQSSGGHVVDVGGIWRVFTPNLVCIGGRTLQWGLAVSRAFGDLALKKPREIVTAEPEISDKNTLQDGSYLILACDGIFDVLSDEETAQAGIEEGPSGILRTAYGRLSDDNLTAIVIKVTQNCNTSGSSKNRHRISSSSSAEPTGKKRKTTDSIPVEAPEMITPSQLI